MEHTKDVELDRGLVRTRLRHGSREGLQSGAVPMRNLRANRFIRSFLPPFSVLLWVGVPACTSWKEVKPPVEQTLERDRPSEARVYLADGTVVELTTPRIVSDSLKGVTAEGSRMGEQTRVSVPLTDVNGVEVRKSDALKTTALAVGVGVLAVGGIMAVAVALSGYPD